MATYRTSRPMRPPRASATACGRIFDPTDVERANGADVLVVPSQRFALSIAPPRRLLAYTSAGVYCSIHLIA